MYSVVNAAFHGKQLTAKQVAAGERVFAQTASQNVRTTMTLAEADDLSDPLNVRTSEWGSEDERADPGVRELNESTGDDPEVESAGASPVTSKSATDTMKRKQKPNEKGGKVTDGKDGERGELGSPDSSAPSRAIEPASTFSSATGSRSDPNGEILNIHEEDGEKRAK